ncbi:MAG: phasin family protein [Xanthobacteraceae bacterium]
MLNSVDDLTKYNKDSMDAAMASLGLVSKGMQAIAAGAADYTKKSLEQGTELLEKMLSAGSVERALEIQSDYVKTTYETFIAESNRMSELCADVAKEVYRPFERCIGTMPTFPIAQGLS